MSSDVIEFFDQYGNLAGIESGDFKVKSETIKAIERKIFELIKNELPEEAQSQASISLILNEIIKKLQYKRLSL